MGEMISKERMLTAFRNQQPDTVPVSPDMSNMIPAKLTCKPFWEVYFYENPPLWVAYIEAVKRYKFDGWSDKGYLGPSKDDKREFRTCILEEPQEAITTRTDCKTPAGELWCETIYYRGAPPWVKRKYVKNLEADFECLKYFYPDPSSMSDEPLRKMTEAMGDLGITGVGVPLPGFQYLFDLMDGGLTAVTRAYYTQYDLVKALSKMQEEWIVAYVERALKFQPDFLLIGASGLLTLQSPKIFRDLSLSTLKRITRMAKQADIPSHLHACGLERYIVEVAATETDLSSIEPLERPPKGDCDLAEIKKKFGKRMALKGNLPTVDVMLLGSPEDVEREAKWCIDVAAEGGGYVLSTGDQCGRDTPEENIFKLVEVARKYGRY